MASLIIDPEEDILTQVHTAQVTESDLLDVMGRELTPQESEFLAEFEQSWKNFVCSKRGKLPAGRRETYLKHLQDKVNELTATRNNVEEELNKQLAYFLDSQDSVDKDLQMKIMSEQEEYEVTEEKLKKELQDVLDASRLQEETLPWNFFLSAVDADAVGSLEQVDPQRYRTVKPSSRAMYLAQQHLASAKDNDVHRRAYQIDHALLSAQSTLLNKQIQRYEKTIASQERASMFLMENNVWSIMNYTVEGNPEDV